MTFAILCVNIDEFSRNSLLCTREKVTNQMRARFFAILILATLVLAPLLPSFATPADAQQGPQAESISATLHFSEADSYYRFRVPNGGMYCEAAVRYFHQGGNEVTTMKMAGIECQLMWVRVDYGNGYEPPIRSTTVGTSGKLRVTTPPSRPFVRVKYHLVDFNEYAQQEVSTNVERVR